MDPLESDIIFWTEKIRKYPNEPNFYFSRGLVYKAMDNYNQAMADFNYAIKLEPKDSGFYHNRGHLFERAEHYKAALDDYTHAIELRIPLDREGMATLYISRGNLYTKLKEFEPALADFARAYEYYDQFIGSTYGAARIYALQQDAKSTCVYLRRAIQVQASIDKELRRNPSFNNILLFCNTVDFDLIRNTNEFQSFLAELKKLIN